MERLFFSNPCFEEELVSHNASVCFLIQSHPVYMQLHYLSCLLVSPGEKALVKVAPDARYIDFLQDKLACEVQTAIMEEYTSSRAELSSWGPSASLLHWAHKKKVQYCIPHMDVVRQVSGKDFVYEQKPRLPGSQLLFCAQEAVAWARSLSGAKVLKSLYGASGRGHLLLLRSEDEAKIAPFLAKVGPVVGEPWVERVMDFSSQWFIEKESKRCVYLGATLCRNSPRGVYRGSIVGPEEELFVGYEEAWREHLHQGKEALQKMITMGFFGAVGLDAMVYLDPKQQKMELQPLVEINARRTMGWLALELFRKLKLEKQTLFEYSLRKSQKENWLPEKITLEGKQEVSLPGELTITVQ